MQPELAARAKEVARQFVLNNGLQSKVSIAAQASLVDTFYEITIGLAVYTYYLNETSKIGRHFTDFYAEFLTTDLKRHVLFRNLQKHSSLLGEFFDNFSFNADSDIEVLGDVHRNSIKFKHQNKVAYVDLFGYERLFNALIVQFPEFENYFSKYKRENNLVFRDFVETDNTDVNLEEFYVNVGRFITYALFFRIIDLNQENVLIKGKTHLYTFDVEALFTPNYESAPYCLKTTGLISGQTEDNNSALLGGLFTINSLLQPVLLGEELDPEIIWKTKSHRKFDNFPICDGTKTHPIKYVEKIKEGMLNGLEYINTHKSEMLRIILNEPDFRFRLIIRPTRAYRYMLFDYVYQQEDILSRTDAKEFFKKWQEEAPILVCGNYTTKMYRHELSELESLSIPQFCCSFNSTDISTIDSMVVGDLPETPKQCFERHADSFSAFVLQEIQELESILRENWDAFQEELSA